LSGKPTKKIVKSVRGGKMNGSREADKPQMRGGVSDDEARVVWAVLMGVGRISMIWRWRGLDNQELCVM
jgi:hypothetical protein